MFKVGKILLITSNSILIACYIVFAFLSTNKINIIWKNFYIIISLIQTIVALIFISVANVKKHPKFALSAIILCLISSILSFFVFLILGFDHIYIFLMTFILTPLNMISGIVAICNNSNKLNDINTNNLNIFFNEKKILNIKESIQNDERIINNTSNKIMFIISKYILIILVLIAISFFLFILYDIISNNKGYQWIYLIIFFLHYFVILIFSSIIKLNWRFWYFEWICYLSLALMFQLANIILINFSANIILTATTIFIGIIVCASMLIISKCLTRRNEAIISAIKNINV